MNPHISVSIEGLGRVLGFTTKDLTPLSISAKVENGVIDLTKSFIDQEYNHHATEDTHGHSIEPTQISSLTQSLSRDILDFCEIVWREGSNQDVQIVRQLADRASEYRWVKINLSTYCA